MVWFIWRHATATASNGADFAARLDLLLGLLAAVWMTALLLMRTRMDDYTIPLLGIAAVSLGRAVATLAGRMRASFAAVRVSACLRLENRQWSHKLVI